MEHVIVQTVARLGGTEHQHWHRSCVEDGPMLELRQLRKVSAFESRPGKLAGARALEGRAAPARHAPVVRRQPPA